jgi:hypothetical protein
VNSREARRGVMSVVAWRRGENVASSPGGIARGARAR